MRVDAEVAIMMIAERPVTRVRAPEPKNGAAIVEARSKARARLEEAIPARYSPWLHLAGTTGVGIVTLVIALYSMRRPTLIELLTVPLTVVFANLFEWRVHKDILHRRLPGLAVLYDRHTPEHHMVFGYDDMAIRNWRELRLVLMPSIGIVGVVVASAPIALLLAKLLGATVGWLFLVTASLYVVLYELSHLSYHLREDSFIGRLKLVRVLREQHRRHHHPRLMQKWNFNVTIPLGDLLHRTMVPKDVLEKTLAQDRSPE